MICTFLALPVVHFQHLPTIVKEPLHALIPCAEYASLSSTTIHKINHFNVT